MYSENGKYTNGQANGKPLQLSEEEDTDLLSQLDLGKLLLVVQKNLTWILLIFAVCVGTSFVYLRYTEAIFEAGSTLQMEVSGSEPSMGLGIFKTENTLNEYLLGEVQMLRSKVVLDEVIKNLQLEIAYYRKGRILYEEKFFNNPFKVEAPEILNPDFYDTQFFVEVIDTTRYELTYDYQGETFTQEYRFGQAVATPHFRFQLATNLSKSVPDLPAGDYYFTIHSQDWLQNYLAANLTVAIADIKARTIVVSFRDP
ncbi:MAG: Wzz/FepE/Etk N-terminal domain-containing protein, partial [Bernardetiaceae bacterium]|nr:Wzz/FepE/Etk N-terminal domain-containing protein [Bernardetiaceae bacterium]